MTTTATAPARKPIVFKKSLVFREIALHPWVHFDEAAGVYLIRNYGSALFRGIAQAGFVFWKTGDTPDGRPGDAWLYDGVVPVGTGHGIFDEHTEDGRKKDACAATLVAEYLEISSMPELAELLAYTLGADSKARANPFSLPTVLKDMNLFLEEDPVSILSWVMEAVTAHVNRRRFELGRQTSARPSLENPLTFDLVLADFLCQYHVQYGAQANSVLAPAIREFFALAPAGTNPVEWLKTNYPALQEYKAKQACVLMAQAFGLLDHPHFRYIIQYVVNPSLCQKGKLPFAASFELPTLIVDIFSDNGGQLEQALDWASVAIAAKLYSSKRFVEAKAEYAAGAKLEVLKTSQGEVSLVSLVSDNPKAMAVSHSAAAARAQRNADIFVLRKPSGHVGVFADPLLDIRDVVKLLRMLEIQKRGLEMPPWDKLVKGGDGPDGAFFYFPDANHLYNSSLSTPDVPRTLLSLDRVLHTIRFALDQKAFPPDFSAGCLKGVCGSTDNDPCPIFAAGLERCHQIRARSKK